MIKQYQPIVEATVLIDGKPYRISNNPFHARPEIGDYIMRKHENPSSLYDGHTLLYRVEKGFATGFNQYGVCYTNCDGFHSQADHGTYVLLKEAQTK